MTWQIHVPWENKWVWLRETKKHVFYKFFTCLSAHCKQWDNFKTWLVSTHQCSLALCSVAHSHRSAVSSGNQAFQLCLVSCLGCDIRLLSFCVSGVGVSDNPMWSVLLLHRASHLVKLERSSPSGCGTWFSGPSWDRWVCWWALGCVRVPLAPRMQAVELSCCWRCWLVLGLLQSQRWHRTIHRCRPRPCSLFTEDESHGLHWLDTTGVSYLDSPPAFYLSNCRHCRQKWSSLPPQFCPFFSLFPWNIQDPSSWFLSTTDYTNPNLSSWLISHFPVTLN